MAGIPIPYDQMREVATNGSPAVLRAFGRAFGLSEAENNALKNNGIPWWIVAVAGVVVGFVAGVQIQRRWPAKIPAFMGGRGG